MKNKKFETETLYKGINAKKQNKQFPISTNQVNKGKTISLLACAVVGLTGMGGDNSALAVTLEGTNHVQFTQTDAAGVSNAGFDLSNSNFAMQEITAVSPINGALKFTDENNTLQYYLFTFTSSGSANSQMTSGISSDISSGFFFKLSNANTYRNEIWGGAIFNRLNTNKNITADFIANFVSASSHALGGAIHNRDGGKIGNITGDFIGNYAHSTGASAEGGAIYNHNGGTIGSITGDFIGNYAHPTGSGTYTQAGAILNAFNSTIGAITGDFIGNYASARGGAICNFYNATINSITGDFIGNYAHSTGASAEGGAIWNHNGGTIGSITGDFIGNYASGGSEARGGAIYNDSGTIGLVAGSKDILFYGNKTINNGATSYNDIFQGGSDSSVIGTTNLNAASGKSITFNGSIIGHESGAKSILNINDSTKNSAVGGTYNFNNTISNTTVNVASGANINFGTVLQDDNVTRSYGGITSGNLNINGSDVSINTQNTNIDTNTVSALTISNPISLAIDASLSNATVDTISATTVTAGANSIVIDAIKLLTGTSESSVDILMTENSVLKAAYTLSNNILNNITKADGVDYIVSSVTYNNETGILTINGGNTSTSDTAQMQVTLPDYLHIEQASIVPSATATIANASTLSLDTAPGVTYNVYSNYSTKLYVTATAPTGETSSNALFGTTTDDMTIVFTNSNGNASTTNIQNCLGASPDYNDNANAIAFKLNCATPVMTTGTTAASVAVNNNNVEYDVHSGMTTLGFSVAQSANAGTFFSNDPTGTYKATLTISNVAP